MQVLIADSSLLIIQRLHELLSETIAVTELHMAVNYQEAWECFTTCRPDIVVLDLSFPAKQPFAFIKEIKEAMPETVVIILSIHIDDYVQQQCSIMGGDFFLDKYHEFDKLTNIINNLHSMREGVIKA